MKFKIKARKIFLNFIDNEDKDQLIEDLTNLNEEAKEHFDQPDHILAFRFGDSTVSVRYVAFIN